MARTARSTLGVVVIIVDSTEYKSWHEVGHATASLHFGGDVDFIEFLDNHDRAHARARCVVTDDMENNVACAGFAAEYYLLRRGFAVRGPDDERDISQIVFHNATDDRQAFWGRTLRGPDDAFSVAEDEAFMHHAINVVAPIFDRYFDRMRMVVRELCATRRIEGERIRQILELSGSSALRGGSPNDHR